MSTITSQETKTSQATKTSQVEAEVNSVWVLTIFYSPYKEDFEIEQIEQRCFLSEERARRAMKKVAKQLYNSEIIQEADDKYYEEYETEIHFGENPESTAYRREFGCCKIECVEIEDRKHRNNM
ncbi:16450_t:CDS:2 [Racocetra persica]|uniref:16450_t:CDS:1 n=1 Tax=Racocetra persica TaxID=160502 RepID=A0ACA9NWG7_9GLOM|nr:16450_t:CDS:2 [Racocetra persica]